MSPLKPRSPLPRPTRDNGGLVPALLAAALAATAVIQLATIRDVTLPLAPAAPIHIADSAQAAFAPATIPSSLQARRIFGHDMPAAASSGSNASPALLAGSIVVRGRGVALLQVEGGQIVRLSPGATWRGMRLERLTPDAAIFRSGAHAIAVPFGSAVQP